MTNSAKSFKKYYVFIDFTENCTKLPGYCYGVFRHIVIKSLWFKLYLYMLFNSITSYRNLIKYHHI